MDLQSKPKLGSSLLHEIPSLAATSKATSIASKRSKQSSMHNYKQSNKQSNKQKQSKATQPKQQAHEDGVVHHGHGSHDGARGVRVGVGEEDAVDPVVRQPTVALTLDSSDIVSVLNHRGQDWRFGFGKKTRRSWHIR